MTRTLDHLLDASDYEGRLTPEENRRRITALRAEEGNRRIGRTSSLPGQSANAGASARMSEEQVALLANSTRGMRRTSPNQGLTPPKRGVSE